MQYTVLTDLQIRGLIEAGASGNEFAAYSLLSRSHKEGDGEHPYLCSMKAKYVERLTGMRADVFSRSLRTLCDKFFFAGEVETPILTHVSSGHNGALAVYNDNLYQYSYEDRVDANINYQPIRVDPLNNDIEFSREMVQTIDEILSTDVDKGKLLYALCCYAQNSHIGHIQLTKRSRMAFDIFKSYIDAQKR